MCEHEAEHESEARNERDVAHQVRGELRAAPRRGRHRRRRRQRVGDGRRRGAAQLGDLPDDAEPQRRGHHRRERHPPIEAAELEQAVRLRFDPAPQPDGLELAERERDDGEQRRHGKRPAADQNAQLGVAAVEALEHNVRVQVDGNEQVQPDDGVARELNAGGLQVAQAARLEQPLVADGGPEQQEDVQEEHEYGEAHGERVRKLALEVHVRDHRR
mmetsp:Transcript_17071/g.41906  ORF Transcript_17071/g.41906 Transcript_17071/m.41906 type:complete len:216 (-) Transcript_17071:104-751(-)